MVKDISLAAMGEVIRHKNLISPIHQALKVQGLKGSPLGIRVKMPEV